MKQLSRAQAMKVAVNIEAIGARRGGAEKYAGTVARWLAAAGHEVHVFARTVDAGELPPSVPVHIVRHFCPTGLGWFRSYLFARASEQRLRSCEFDLIIGLVKVWYQHVYLAVGGAHPAALRCNSARFQSDLARGLWWIAKWLSPKQWIFRHIAHKQFAGAHRPHIIAPAKMVQEHFQRYHGISSDRISVVPNALDSLTTPADRGSVRRAFRSRHHVADGDVVVLFVARNYVLKGLEPLLEAFAHVSLGGARETARLVVCGSHKDRRFRRQARTLGIADRVLFLGFVEDIRECFASADIFAFPTFYDPCSLVVLEAMNAGLPVLTTRQNGAGELLTDGVDGFVIESAWAVDRLAGRLVELVDDANLRERMGKHAQITVRRVALPSLQAQLLAALERAAADRLASPRLRTAA